MADQGGAIQRRLLAAQLRKLREEREYTLEQVANELLISTSKLSRLENANGLPQKRDVRDLARYYRAGKQLSDTMLAWVDESRRRPWWQKFVVGKDTDGDYMEYESAASEIHGYSARLIPSLLQAESYMRAQIASANPEPLDDTVMNERVAIRLGRQAEWGQSDSTMLDIVIDEVALYRQVGDANVMREQLIHLAEVADKEPRVSVRIIRFEEGPHWASQDGTFTVFKFPDGVPTDVAKSESSDRYLDDPKVTSRFLDRFDVLCDVALSPEESPDYVVSVADTRFPRDEGGKQ